MTTTGATNVAWASALFEELCLAGVRHVFAGAGLRSLPLVAACLRVPALALETVVDERTGAFLALGAARASGIPAVFFCTSGSAGAHALPAVVEARHARVPLIVITADRPARLHDCGAPQTIEQGRLFGEMVLAVVELPEPSADARALRYARVAACRAVQRATGRPAGPVHINVPFDEPLVPELELAQGRGSNGATHDTASELGHSWVAARRGTLEPSRAALDEAVRWVREHPRGLIVCGDAGSSDPGLAIAVHALARATGYPIVADPLSSVRHARAGDDVRVLGAVDAWIDHLPPLDPAPLVVHVGAAPVSKALARWIERHHDAVLGGVRHLVIDEAGGHREPSRGCALAVEADPGPCCVRLAMRLAEGHAVADGAWVERLVRAEVTACDLALEATRVWGEPALARALADLVPADVPLWVASSKPIRMLDWFAPSRGDGRRVLGARGANGIDGTLAQAVGAARALGKGLVVYTGDLALLHDLGSLDAVADAPVAIVVANDGGGGIFPLLPGAARVRGFDEHVVRRHGRDFALAARMFGIAYAEVEDRAGLAGALEGFLATGEPILVECPLDLDREAEAHRGWRASLAESLGAALAGSTP